MAKRFLSHSYVRTYDCCIRNITSGPEKCKRNSIIIIIINGGLRRLKRLTVPLNDEGICAVSSVRVKHINKL